MPKQEQKAPSSKQEQEQKEESNENSTDMSKQSKQPPEEEAETSVATHPEAALRASIRDELLEIEARLQEQTAKDRSHWNKRIGELESELYQIQKSRLWQELQSLNAVARHLNILQRQAEERLEATDNFFNNLEQLQSRKGTVGAYERSLQELRNNQMAFSTIFSEIQEQRLLWNQLVERLKQQE